ncbi:hypothetical protein [Pseudomonas donghuensis]|uniref:hypothetical protein n=1 Tax=Pseudomonas donghuensis TaxID=1163398 RepID=UPI002E12988D|nr:hypothetical protein VP780_12745 [Pseudomonas donghuensis]
MSTRFPGREVAGDLLQRRQVFRGVVELAAGRAPAQHLPPAGEAAVPAVPLVAMVIGVDDRPRPMALAEVQGFGDPFTTHMLLKGLVPLTLSDFSAAIEGLIGEAARPLRKLYVVAEGSGFQSTTPSLPMNTRLVITWQKDTATPPDFLLSTTVDLDDPGSLLQLIAWSELQGVFHFFERTGAGWGWAGSSMHALQDGSRGQGPFDSHINGGLVMKELKAPWNHWHTQSNGIPRDLIFKTDVELNHPLFSELAGAQELEDTVKTGVRRWTKRRLQKDLLGGQLLNLKWYARQLLWTTSVNLISSTVLSKLLPIQAEIALPRSFFFDADGIGFVAGQITDLPVLPSSVFSVQSSLYSTVLDELQVHVEAQDGGPSVQGDTNFVFLVPERAFEDQAVVEALVRREVLSPRLGLCLLMVDFTNPVFSAVRAALLGLFPEVINQGNKGAALDSLVISQAQAHPSPATLELLQLWDDPDLITTVKRRLAGYATAVQSRLRTHVGVTDLVKLADSRKEAFRTRKLNEFRHTTSMNGATVSHLAMDENGSVFTKNTGLGEEEN